MLYLSEEQINRIEIIQCGYDKGGFGAHFDYIDIYYKDGWFKKRLKYTRIFQGESYRQTREYIHSLNYLINKGLLEYSDGKE